MTARDAGSPDQAGATLIGSSGLFVATAMGVMVPSSPQATYSMRPSGAMASAPGPPATGIGGPGLPVQSLNGLGLELS